MIIDAEMAQMSFGTSLRLTISFGRLTLEAKDMVDKRIAFILSKSYSGSEKAPGGVNYIEARIPSI